VATFVIGDIHGNLAALSDVLSQLRPELTGSDTVVFLGDYIDRGPESRGCIDAVLTFRREIGSEVVCLLGNHEDWLLRTMHDYGQHSWLLGMEAFDTIRSYSPDAERALREAVAHAGADLYLGRCDLPYDVFFDCVPDEHRQFFEGLWTHHRTSECVCTHGGLDPRVARLEDQLRTDLLWGAGTFPRGYEGDEIVVYGHRNNATVDAQGRVVPAVMGRTIGIDTSARGMLIALRLPDQQVFQSACHGAADLS
jgi:serine/threonine protein phosphatase 1